MKTLALCCALALAGALPEGLLRLQQLGRRIYADAVRQSESG